MRCRPYMKQMAILIVKCGHTNLNHLLFFNESVNQRNNVTKVKVRLVTLLIRKSACLPFNIQ